MAASRIILAALAATGISVAAGSSNARGQGTVGELIMPAPASAAENAAALRRFFAQPGRATLHIPGGTYQLPCGSKFVAAGALSIVGEGTGRTVLRFVRACELTGAVMAWNSKSGVRLSGFTLDLNDSRSAAPQNVIQFQAFDGSADGLLIDHIAILNGNSPSLQLVVAAARGFTYSGVVIDHNRLEMKPGTTQNQCIALTTVQGFGQILSARVTHNTCRGSGIQLDGVGPTAADNDVSGYQFGMGIFTAFVERTPVAAADWSNGVVTVRLAAARNRFVRGEHVHVWGATPAAYNGTFTVDEVTADGVSYAVPRDPGRYASGGFLAPDPTSRNCVIRGNILHDTPQTLDVNHTAPGGVENNCVDSLVENNRAYDLGGAGFANYASGARYVGNYAREVGFRGHGSAGGDGDDAAFAVADNGSGMPWYRSSGVVFEGNTSEPGSGRPRFGYYEEPSHLFNTRRQSNAFAGAEQSTVIRSPSCLGASARC